MAYGDGDAIKQLTEDNCRLKVTVAKMVVVLDNIVQAARLCGHSSSCGIASIARSAIILQDVKTEEGIK